MRILTDFRCPALTRFWFSSSPMWVRKSYHPESSMALSFCCWSASGRDRLCSQWGLLWWNLGPCIWVQACSRSVDFVSRVVAAEFDDHGSGFLPPRGIRVRRRWFRTSIVIVGAVIILPLALCDAVPTIYRVGMYVEAQFGVEEIQYKFICILVWVFTDSVYSQAISPTVLFCFVLAISQLFDVFFNFCNFLFHRSNFVGVFF